MTNLTGAALAVNAIEQTKARYFRGVDLNDGSLVRSILAEDCVLDYMGCCTDPISGTDHLPAMNIVMRGRSAWADAGLGAAGIVSAHHGYTPDIELIDESTAQATWAMMDRLWMPAGAPFPLLTGYGHYHETYIRDGDQWLIKTLRISRIRVDVR